MKATKLNSIVACYFQTTAPSTSRMARNATAAICGGKDKVARAYATVIETKGTPCGRAVSLQNSTGEKIREHALVNPLGGYYVHRNKIETVQAIIDDAQAKMDDIREEIVADYPAFRKRLQARLREIEIAGVKLSGEFKLPTATEIAEAYTMRVVWADKINALGNSTLKGLADEVANRAAAESEQAVEEALKEAHAGPVADLRNRLVEFCDKVRNAERLHPSQFDKLADELRRVKDLNVLGLPAIAEVIKAAAPAAQAKASGSDLTTEQRHAIADTGEDAIAKADAVLDDLGF